MSDKNPYLNIDRQMVGDIYTSNEVMDNLTVLCDDFGSRFPGTPEERKAAEFIAASFDRYGLKNSHLEPYPYAGWRRGEATLEILEPMQKKIPCISLPYCPAQEVRGELISVGCGTPADFERLGNEIEGRIVLASSASPSNLGRWVHRQEKYERTVIGNAKVFIFISELPGVGPETGSLQDDKPAPIPGISVCKEDGEFLTRLMERKGKVELMVRTLDVNEPLTSQNAIADLPGNDNSEDMVVVGCHFDGHDISQGAHDPASGMVMVMEAARALSAYAGDSLKRTIRFIGFSTEEIGLIGSYRYVDAHRDELDKIKFYFNLDAAGGPGRKGIILHNWHDLEPFFRRAGEEMAVELPVGQHVNSYSDHFPFFLEGVPSGNMGDPERGPSGRGFGHTRYDTLDKIETENLRAGSSVAAQIALRVANTDNFPALRRDKKAVQEIINSEHNLEGYRVKCELMKNKVDS